MKIYFVRKIEDKLQLLSRNFDVGDTVYWYRPREDEPRIVGSFLNNKPGSWFPKGVEKQLGSLKGIHSYTWGKIIGEISSEATWVKEGDEFEQKDIKKLPEIVKCIDNESLTRTLKIGQEYTNGDNQEGCVTVYADGKSWTFTSYKRWKVIHPKYIQIKGPCGHFH